MRRILSAALFAAVAGLASACDEPVYPKVPDGGKASEAEMGEAQQRVKKYMAAANDYLACLDASIREATSKTDKKQLNISYNSTVDRMNDVAGAFNAAVKAYQRAN